MILDPIHYNLPSRTQLEYLSEGHIAIVKLIKSRIIRKDAEKILLAVNQIKAADLTLTVSLICSKNICSKSIALLKSEGVDIIFRE